MAKHSIFVTEYHSELPAVNGQVCHRCLCTFPTNIQGGSYSSSEASVCSTKTSMCMGIVSPHT